MIKLLLSSLISLSIQASSNFILDEAQIQRLNFVYSVAKSIKAQDGTSFEYALVGIYYVESAAGIFDLGDHKGTSYYFIEEVIGPDNNIIKVKIPLAPLRPILRAADGLYTQDAEGRLRKLYKVENSVKNLKDASLGGFQIKPSTAKEVIESFYTDETAYLLKDDTTLEQNLLHNLYISTVVAAHILVYHYNNALKKGMSNPYFRAISKYNGGYLNTTYYNKVKNKIKLLHKFINTKE